MPSLAPTLASSASLGLCVLLVGCPRSGPEPAAPTTTPTPSERAPTVDEPPATADTPPEVVEVDLDHPGCFLLQALDTGEVLRGGTQPCDVPTVPASTFKIPHALIALDTGVVTDPDQQVEWDGTRYPHMEAWERDHDLRSAIYESVVWYFQQTARAIGRERMTEYLRAFDYGNATVEEPIDLFWLDGGSLRISPESSLRFMAALYRGTLPRGVDHLPALYAMLERPPESFRGRVPDDWTVPAAHPEMVFSAKTGTDSHRDGNVTWLVGHVGCPKRDFVFVSRVIAPGPPSALSPATMHGFEALAALGILECGDPLPRATP